MNSSIEYCNNNNKIHFSSSMKFAIEKKGSVHQHQKSCLWAENLYIVAFIRTLMSNATSRQPYQFKAHRSICMALHIQDQGK